MPIYMDRHDVSEAVTAENVAQLHQQDLKIQDKFGCRGLTYWFDGKRKTAFCLVEAPNEKALFEMHKHAHGEVPNQIIEVDISVVESFLGRIEEPQSEQEAELKIIDEPAFRIIMMTGIDDHALAPARAKNKPLNLAFYMKSLTAIFNRFDGRIVKQRQNNFLVSFKSVSMAVDCSMELHKQLIEWSNVAGGTQINLKTGISQGIPFSGNESFFEESVQMAKRLFYISDSKIVLSHEVKKLYADENADAHFDRNLFLTLTHSDEKFISCLMNYLEENWQNPNLQVDDVAIYVGCSKSQLYRKMISLIGTSPNNFIKRYRLNKALALIRDQTGNVSEVAYETGFNSPSYFAKCFHKRYGVLPSEYLQGIEK